MEAFRTVMGEVGALARAALRGFLLTSLVWWLFSIVVAVVALFFVARVPHHAATLMGGLAAAITLGTAAVLWFPLATKQAVSAALVAGILRAKLAERSIQWVFTRMIDLSGEKGERGHALLRGAEKLPLSQAEARLKTAIGEALSSVSEPQSEGLKGALARRFERSLLGSVEKLTLARFREEGPRHGGVDLEVLRDELGPIADGQIADRIKRSARDLTLMSAGAVVAVALFAELVLAWLAAQNLTG